MPDTAYSRELLVCSSVPQLPSVQLKNKELYLGQRDSIVLAHWVVWPLYYPLVLTMIIVGTY